MSTSRDLASGEELKDDMSGLTELRGQIKKDWFELWTMQSSSSRKNVNCLEQVNFNVLIRRRVSSVWAWCEIKVNVFMLNVESKYLTVIVLHFAVNTFYVFESWLDVVLLWASLLLLRLFDLVSG